MNTCETLQTRQQSMSPPFGFYASSIVYGSHTYAHPSREALFFVVYGTRYWPGGAIVIIEGDEFVSAACGILIHPA